MSIMRDNIKSLSRREVQIIAELEFKEKYYFTREDIKQHFESKSKLNYAIHRLISKKRIIKLNRNKYYLVPIKARSGIWTDDPFIIADEICNGKDYYIGGWAAANYWRLTDQIPMKIEVYTNKRNGVIKVLSNTFILRKTTQHRINAAVVENISGHVFRILDKKESKEWLKLRNF
jgi:predicted transcriptional regulator of viral defense system